MSLADQTIDMELRIQDVRTDEVYWRLNPTEEVYKAIMTAIMHRPKSRLVVGWFPPDGNATKVDVVDSVVEAKQKIHALIFDAYVRSAM